MGAERRTDAGTGLFMAERTLATILGIVAIVLGVIGLLRGFGLIGPEGVDIGADIGGLPTGAAQGSFWDAMLWMIPGAAAGILAIGVGRSEHLHTGGLSMSTHTGAYIMAVLTIVLGALAILIGFDVFNQNYAQTDGLIWAVSSIISGSVGAAFHMAVPALVADEDYLVSVVESRVAGARPAGGPVPGSERTS